MMSKPLGRSGQREAIDVLAEDSLYFIGSQREYAAKRARLEKMISGLEDAARVERDRLLRHVEEARQQLRDATCDLERHDEIEAQEAEVRAEILTLGHQELQTYDLAVERISADAIAVGFAYARPVLAGEGELKAAVAQRKRVRAAGASKTEAEAI